jgi:hypothetical protein
MVRDSYVEMYLWNRGMDRLLRVLQRLETVAILSRKEMKAYEVRLAEIRAALNADFAERIAARERDDEGRLRRQRLAWEEKPSDSAEK